MEINYFVAVTVEPEFCLEAILLYKDTSNTVVHAQEAERTGKRVFGVKGLSPLVGIVGVPCEVLLD